MKTISTALQNLVHILNDGQLHSGHDLSQALHISRNAVWKHINQLAKYDIDIESIQSTGYRLKSPLILLNENEIRKHLQDPKVKLSLLGSVASTNDYVRELPASSQLQFCLAEHQIKGRGRFGRTWLAPFGANILLSCRFSLEEDLSHLGGLSLCIGLAILKAVQEFGLEELSCKWPNDILYRNKKLAGILIETRGEAHNLSEAIIGIGLNVNMQEAFLKQVDRPITSLEAILGMPQDRNKIAALIINSLCHHLTQFQKQGLNKTEWDQYDFLHGKDITLHVGTEYIQGLATGVDASGHLLLKLPSGEVKAYSAGEASLS